MTDKSEEVKPVSLLAEAAVAIGALEKDRENTYDDYQYLSERIIKAAARMHVAGRGLLPCEIRFEILSDEWRPYGRQSNVGNFVKVRCTLSIRDGESLHVVDGLGAGVDYTDKAMMKAQTSAIREAWKNLLIISDGNDPEGAEAGNDGAMSPEKASAVAELDKLEKPVDLREWWKKHSKDKTGDVRVEVWEVFKARCAKFDLDAQEVAK